MSASVEKCEGSAGARERSDISSSFYGKLYFKRQIFETENRIFISDFKFWQEQ